MLLKSLTPIGCGKLRYRLMDFEHSIEDYAMEFRRDLEFADKFNVMAYDFMSVPGVVVPFDKWQENKNITSNFSIRFKYTPLMGFPIVTKETADRLANFLSDKKTLDAGCGAGHLASALKDRKIDVTAVDNFATEYKPLGEKSESYQSKATDFVINGNFLKMDLSEYKAIILSWPDMSNGAFKLAKKMEKGQYLIYQGEGGGGCTANDAFHDYIDQHFVELEDISDKLNEYHIQFKGIHDYWSVFQKK